jgi:hypothetical protein
MRTWTFIQYLQGFLNLQFRISVIAVVSFNLITIALGCRADPSRPSILVIAVDHLGADAITCSKDFKSQNSRSGFEVLCREFSRWSHAYTTSTLTVPAVSSLMTGEYPLTHGVRHNGNQYLPASFETATEIAFQKGWSTLLISGGAPLLRKTGLSQGFQIFDDSIRPSLDILHRPVRQGFQLLLNHLKEIGDQTSMAWIYAPDLLFTNLQTRNNLGELRNLSYESQLEQFDEDLAKFFGQMKELKFWNNTTIILTGLNSRVRGEHQNITEPENLFNESTQVSLFVKWAGNPPPTTYDDGVSLADVGSTLHELVNGPTKETDQLDFPVYSLKSSGRSTEKIKERWLPIESAWQFWQKHGDIRWAFRREPLLCLRNESLKCFNSLTDREEVLPLTKIEVANIEFNPTVKKLLEETSLPVAIADETKSPHYLEHPCYQLIKSGRFQLSDLKKCDDSSSLDLAQWISDDQNFQLDSIQKDTSRKKFLKTFWLYLLDKKIEESNIQLGLIWDTSPDKFNRKGLLEAILELPEVAKYKSQALRAMTSYREEESSW